MTNGSGTRRDFLATAAAAAAATVVPASAQGRQGSSLTRRAIGCHSRPFSSFRLGHDALLDAIKACRLSIR